MDCLGRLSYKLEGAVAPSRFQNTEAEDFMMSLAFGSRLLSLFLNTSDI